MSVPKPPMPLNAAPFIRDWIRVSPNGVLKVLSGRVELGQGSASAIRRMAADELGCVPDAIVIETGQTGLTPNEGFTAGSMSVSGGGQAVRWAASAFRNLILHAASSRLGCEAGDLRLADGVVLKHGEPADINLATFARDFVLDEPVADWAAPLMPDPVNSADTLRFDLRERLVGAPFVHDLDRPGLLFGKPVHPPTMTAVLEALDLEALRARPGVVAVVRDGSFVGIVAETEVEAIAAVRWARGQARWIETVQAPNDAIQAIGASTEPAETVVQTDKIEETGGRRFDTTVSRPYLHHGSIGPSAAVAEWQEGDLTIWCHSQGVYQLRTALGMVFSLPEERITVIHRPGSGCYGHNGADDVALDAALMAKAVPGRPVKVVWSRRDEFQIAPLGPGMVTRCAATVDDGGRITSMRVDVNSAPHANRPSVNGTPNLRAAAYLESPIPPAPSTDIPVARGGGADRNAIPLYAVPNLEINKRIVHSLPYRSSSLRSLGAYTNIYAIETLMDEIALDLGIDPLVFRLMHLQDERAKAVIEAVDDAASSWRREVSGQGTGWGLGFARYKNTAGYCAVMARVEVDQEIRVTEIYAVADIGEVISRDGAINQIEGGIIQSMSWTLKEAAILEGSKVAAESWLDYPILRFSEVPNLSVRLLEQPDQPPLGCGEISQGPTAAALGNALRSAIGVTVRDLPLTRDRVMQALF